MITRLPRAAIAGAEPVEHVAVHQQPVDQHDRAVALAVVVVGDPPALVLELRHCGSLGGARAARLPRGGSVGRSSQGRAARSAPRIARVAGQRLRA